MLIKKFMHSYRAVSFIILQSQLGVFKDTFPLFLSFSFCFFFSFLKDKVINVSKNEQQISINFDYLTNG
jgi:hypothetical protein